MHTHNIGSESWDEEDTHSNLRGQRKHSQWRWAGKKYRQTRLMVDWTPVPMLQKDKQYLHKCINNTSPHCGRQSVIQECLGACLSPCNDVKYSLAIFFMALSAFESCYDNYHNTSLSIISPKNLPSTHDINICYTCKKNERTNFFTNQRKDLPS